jgi:serine/threonine protein kinase
MAGSQAASRRISTVSRDKWLSNQRKGCELAGISGWDAQLIPGHTWAPNPVVPMLSSSLSTVDSNFKTLLEDGGAMVCRGLDSTDGETRSVLAVIPASDAPSSDFLDRLHHEYELREALDSGWAARPLQLVERLEVSERQRGPLLLLDDPGGEFLERLLGRPMPAEPFLRLALGLTRATRKLHQQGLIHKDITPAHILVDQASGAAWLTGFGIATRLPRERTLPDPPELIAGTLAYMAPEQTGRMNRSIDARSDLYALGVIFYRMLTGSLPFAASDPMEWVHCHIARKPARPCTLVQTIPVALSDIVMKLLAKTVEERYQTAAGLESDLERCLAEWGAHGRLPAWGTRHAGPAPDPRETIRTGARGRDPDCRLRARGENRQARTGARLGLFRNRQIFGRE